MKPAHRIVFCVLLSCSVAACGGSEQSAAANNSGLSAQASPTAQTLREKEAIAPWDASRCGDDAYLNAKMERHPALMGMTPEALEAAYGAPGEREGFRVGEPAGTFYGALGKRVSGPPHRDEGADARVLTWTKSGCNFSVFFVASEGRFAAVNAFEWSPDADF